MQSILKNGIKVAGINTESVSISASFQAETLELNAKSRADQ